MEDVKRLVFVVGPEGSGKDTLVGLITGKKVKRKLKMNIATYKFDLAVWNAPKRTTRGVYTSPISKLNLLKEIITLRKPKHSYFIVTFPFRCGKMSFSELNSVIVQAKDLCSHVKSMGRDSSFKLLLAVSKLDTFLLASREDQNFNKGLLVALTSFHQACLIPFCSPDEDPQLAQEAREALLSFIADEPGGEASLPSLSTAWSQSEKAKAQQTETSAGEITLESLRAEFEYDPSIIASINARDDTELSSESDTQMSDTEEESLADLLGSDSD